VPVPVLTTPAFIGPAGGSGLLSDLESGAGSGGVAAVAAGVVGLGLTAVAVPLLAAPAGGALAAGGVAAGGLLAAGAFLKTIEQLREWGLVNYRPQPLTESDKPGVWVNVGTATDVPITVTFGIRGSTIKRRKCDNSASFPDIIGQFFDGDVAAGTGVSYRVSNTKRVVETRCGTGTNVPSGNVPLIEILRANGTTQVIRTVFGDGLIFNATDTNESVTEWSNFRAVRNGVTYRPQVVTPQDFAPGTRPQLFPPTLPDAPVLPAPAGVPVPSTPVLPPPPDRRPLAPPVTIPRPGQQPARVPVPGPRPGPAPGPGPAPTPSQPAPASVPAIGPLPAPRPLPVPATPAEVVVVDGQVIGGPAQAPRPNLTAIANELGRQERKLEIALTRPENGGAGELAENSLLAILRGLLERLVEELLNSVPGGSFSLSHPCPPPGGSEPLPPVEVPYGGGGNAALAALAKLDGIAELIQAHKDMGQPTCRTPRVGQEVTVHFESEG
jgi:hypothetical protein